MCQRWEIPTGVLHPLREDMKGGKRMGYHCGKETKEGNSNLECTVNRFKKERKKKRLNKEINLNTKFPCLYPIESIKLTEFG